MADYSNIDNILYFAQYDKVSKKLIYSKYNFNFELYKKDFKLENKEELDIFIHFLKKNETYFQEEPSFKNKGNKTPSYLKPTVVKENLKKYFLQMTEKIINYHNKYSMTAHAGYIHIQDPPDYYSVTELVKNQFKMKQYKNNEIKRIQDFIYLDKEKSYTKYNFDFDKYSNDFIVYGNKLSIFTDFISRVIYSSGSVIGAIGYGNPYGFKKYFINQNEDELIDYMSQYGVSSNYKTTFKNEFSVNYAKYAKLYNLDPNNLVNAQEHYYRFGQFNQTVIEFNEKKSSSVLNNLSSICTIYSSKGTSSGFLYKNKSSDKEIYIITCAHAIDKTNLSTFLVTFGLVDNSLKNTVTKAEFRVMGRDIFTDILVGVYDPSLPYNETFKPDLSPYRPFTIDLLNENNLGDDVYAIGNLGMSDNNALVKGTLIDNKYIGDFHPESTLIPDTLLIDMKGTNGLSGSPIFSDKDDTKVIGMCIGSIKDNKFVTALTPFILDTLATNVIARWAVFKNAFPNDPVKLEYYTKNAITKRWLGAITSYYHPQISYLHNPSLASYPGNSGLVIHDFILGFDKNTNLFVFDSDTLVKQNIAQIHGPLLNSKMFKRFTETGKTPIIINSITFNQGIIGQFYKYEFGKFSNQQGFNNFHYGFLATGTKETPVGSSNSLVGTFGKIFFEYYYYNGKEWILEKDSIYADDESNYCTYIDGLGNSYYQNKFDFPQILITYLSSYAYKLDNELGIGNGIYSPLGENTNNSGNSGRTSGWALNTSSRGNSGKSERGGTSGWALNMNNSVANVYIDSNAISQSNTTYQNNGGGGRR